MADYYRQFNQAALDILWRMASTNTIVRSVQLFREGLLFQSKLKFSRELHESVSRDVEYFFKQAMVWLDAFSMVPVSYRKNRWGFIIPIVPDFNSGRFVWEMTETDEIHVVWVRNVDVLSARRIIPVFVVHPPSMNDRIGVLSRMRSLYDDYLLSEAAKRVYMVSMHRRANPPGFLTMDTMSAAHLRAGGGSDPTYNDQTEYEVNDQIHDYRLATKAMLGMLDHIAVAEKNLQRWDERNEKPERQMNGFTYLESVEQNKDTSVQPLIQPLPPGWKLTPGHEPRDPNIDANDKMWRSSVEGVFSIPVDQIGGRVSAVTQFTVHKISAELRAIQHQLNELLEFFCVHSPDAFETSLPVTNMAEYKRAISMESDMRPDLDDEVLNIMQHMRTEKEFSNIDPIDVAMRVRQFLKVAVPQTRVVTVKWKSFDTKELTGDEEQKGAANKRPAAKTPAAKKPKNK